MTIKYFDERIKAIIQRLNCLIEDKPLKISQELFIITEDLRTLRCDIEDEEVKRHYWKQSKSIQTIASRSELK
jgi:uncharacterized hydantoinase/oxoprolinase family protein